MEADDGFSGALVHVAQSILELNACTPSCALWFSASLESLSSGSVPLWVVVGSELRQADVV